MHALPLKPLGRFAQRREKNTPLGKVKSNGAQPSGNDWKYGDLAKNTRCSASDMTLGRLLKMIPIRPKTNLASEAKKMKEDGKGKKKKLNFSGQFSLRRVLLVKFIF